jgi:hypothetical protein
MKTMTVPVPGPITRVLVLGGAIAGLGLATWYGTRPPPVDDGGSFVEQPDLTPPNGSSYQPIVYRDRGTSEGACSPWDLSPVAMEAILQEMIRRGWKPPTQGEAIAGIAPPGSQMAAIDPNAPLPVFTRPTAPPVETVEPEEGVVSDDPDPTMTPPATTTPATRPPAASPSRPPAAQPPAATPPRTAPPAAATPRSSITQPPAAPKPATPPTSSRPPAIPPAAPPPGAEPEEPDDPT